jgi:hypothetical protein
MSTTKIIIIVVVGVVIAGVIFLGVVGLALGLGLGLGLQKSNPPPSKLTAPTVNCNPAQATCGCPATKPAVSSRIINGNIAAANSWPWIVYLTMNGTKVCTGFLISQRHVITASSCITAYPASNITVNIGSSIYQSQTVGTNVTSANFTNVPGVLDNVAIVTLGINVTYGPTIQPCCLTSDLTQPFINEIGVIAGWGETSSSSLGTVAPSLEEAVIEVRSPSVCNLQTSSNQFCASFDSISTCPIDTGAPFMVALNNAWTCVGIATGATTSCTNPTTFTEVSAYAGFIKNITGIIF